MPGADGFGTAAKQACVIDPVAGRHTMGAGGVRVEGAHVAGSMTWNPIPVLRLATQAPARSGIAFLGYLQSAA